MALHEFLNIGYNKVGTHTHTIFSQKDELQTAKG